MKNFILLCAIFTLTIGSAQNNRTFSSIQPLTPSISGEIFRFQPGVVTQLDQGSTFSTSNRFFTLGRFVNGIQTTYGLNFVVNGKGVGLGYASLSTLNPQIVWKGANSSSLGDLEFRYSPNFTPGSTELTATMRSDGSTIFGEDPNDPLFANVTVGVYSERQFGLKEKVVHI